MADLRLALTPVEPSSKEAVIVRLKKVTPPDGVLQCPRCGSRTVLNTEDGVVVKNGRRGQGTRIKIDLCADCDAQGIRQPMQAVPRGPDAASAAQAPPEER